jgi:hypothetical protein
MKRVVVTLFTTNMVVRKVSPKTNFKSLATDRTGMKRKGLLGAAGYLRIGSGSGMGRRLEPLRAGEPKANPLLTSLGAGDDDEEDTGEAFTAEDALRAVDDRAAAVIAGRRARARGATKPSIELASKSELAAAAMRAHLMVLGQQIYRRQGSPRVSQPSRSER